MEAINSKELTKIFEVQNRPLIAVDRLSFKIKKGNIVALLGPNGAGKTTTVRIVASIFHPSSGDITVHGLHTVTNSLEVRRQIGIAHERPSFYERLSGRRNLQFFAELYDVPSSEIDEKIDSLAFLFDLIDAIDQPVGSYSKGMRQKLSVAKALVHDPPLLILDEPWSGLSPGATRDLRMKILELGKAGKTILITTHNLAQAEQVADRLLLISHGKLVAEGTPHDLREQYKLKPQLLVKSDNVDELDLTAFYSDTILNIQSQGNFLVIDIDSFQSTPAILKLLIEHGVRIHEVRENVPSLEEIYLHLVEDGHK